MRLVAAIAAVVALLIGGARAGAAQEETEDLLRQSRGLYERLEIERALPLLRRLVAPGWAYEITDAQRVEAYRYLGAALTLSGKRDSAIVYFRAALERDPFTDLDAADFTPDQLAAFAAARRLTFSVGVRGGDQRVDPRTQRVVFTVVSTHAAALRCIVRGFGATAPDVVLFNDRNDGVREITWDGLGGDARLAPPGRYEVLVVGHSQIVNRADSAHIFLDLTHDVEPLEDTLPDLTAADLLPERYGHGTPATDLAKGAAVAVGALTISGALGSDQLGSNDVAPVVAGVALAAGVVAFVHRSSHLELPQNVAANQQRRAARQAENDAIRRRNAERLGRTVLVVKAAAGVGSSP